MFCFRRSDENQNASYIFVCQTCNAMFDENFYLEQISFSNIKVLKAPKYIYSFSSKHTRKLRFLQKMFDTLRDLFLGKFLLEI